MEGIGLGILIGIGLTSFKRVYRPMAKGALKLGLTTADAVKDAVHEGRETLADLLAEVKLELAEEPRPAAASGIGAQGRGKPEPPASN
jgi:hypothetical protein